jgi:methionyl aminopeptidase
MVPVLILFFNNPQKLSRVFEQVRKARPTHLFLYQDGPRDERDAAGIAACGPGVHIGDVSYAIQKVAEDAGFGVVRDWIGHGVGRTVHEDPQVPNFGKPGTKLVLRPGMTIAIEPMIALTKKGERTDVLEDGWTVVTRDRSMSAHFEHTVAITDDGCEVLTLPADYP